VNFPSYTQNIDTTLYLSHVAEDDDALQRVLPGGRWCLESVGLAPHDGSVQELMPNLVEVPESQAKLVLSKRWQYEHGNYCIICRFHALIERYSNLFYLVLGRP
jgi:hypothetical protein